ncbi:SDR family NAD(P)-dependent oxidoreductase [Streptomyces griseoluteus]|uniref:SDR family NAD(P)-dependent oxidoreductase n=1 Tax=Streptomyces griseoluteus TaxID=29306 RepID=UPI0037F87315
MTRSGDTLAPGMSALVTGGSRGLGLLIAGHLAGRGCEVTILARDSEELGRAMGWIHRRTGRTVRAVVCDVRDEGAVTAAVDEAAAAHGGLDVVIANAGVIQVAPAETAGSRAFHDAMATIFDGTLYTCLAALPHLRRSSHGGRLGLIGSVGALVSPPHLVPYSCAKAAVRALGEGLRAETAGSAVSVTTVHPGLMRTGSHLQAEFGGQSEEEYAWFSTLSVRRCCPWTRSARRRRSSRRWSAAVPARSSPPRPAWPRWPTAWPPPPRPGPPAWPPAPSPTPRPTTTPTPCARATPSAPPELPGAEPSTRPAEP